MKRPPFNPFEGLTLADINNTVKELEQTELVRNIKLHEELNRQLRLRNLNEQHMERYLTLNRFGEEKQKYLLEKEKILSSAEARKQLHILDSCLTEINFNKHAVEELNSRGEYLRSEHFEFSADVTQKETRINSLFTELHNLYNKKKNPF